MRASVVIAAHNEGDLLWKTVRSTVETARGLDCEILVADDASTDGCVREARRRYAELRVVGFSRRRGCSAAKDLGARRARGRVIVFMDGHCKPEPYSIHQLISDVEALQGKAILTPTVPSLDVNRWRCSDRRVGHGYLMSLATFSARWIPLERMRRVGPFFEVPALVGCCLAMSKELYGKLRGFDRHMIEWGVEDVDMGIKAWLLGHAVLHDPSPIIGHRFISASTSFTVHAESVVANEIRTARKNFTEPVWNEWLRRAERRHSKTTWAAAWALYQGQSRSADEERRYLMSERVHDEAWYARRFGLRWPRGRG
ncbi:MAG: glycosyltransferase [Planctomycetes bacterium]|nr:glycosyltransferase [Planctomycetota bacterium]